MFESSSVFRGRACGHAPPPLSERPKIILTRHTVKNGISNLYILLKSALKMQEMPFQRPKIEKRSGPPYNCVVTPLTKILSTLLCES